MKLKDGVKILGIRPELLLGIMIADSIYHELFNKGITITSICDGTHSRNSLHNMGLAFDLRSRDDSGKQWDQLLRQQVVNKLSAALGEDFDVIGEYNHIHIEYQVHNK